MQKLILYILLLSFCANLITDEKKEFKKAKNENTAAAYTKFINKFPNSDLAKEAKLLRTSLDSIEVIISTFLGNETRNYYGNTAPDNLNEVWKFYLGEGVSPAYGYNKIWKGAGWTGQPLLVKEKGELFVIQGAFDYSIHKINATTGEEIWSYKFDDILKGTGSIWVNHNAENVEDRYVIIQGSRKGWDKDKESQYCTSLRAVSYMSGKELWKMNSVATDCYSRDVDGSALIINDTAYLALENGLFTVFNPDYKFVEQLDGIFQPKIYQQIQYYNQSDIDFHGDDLVAEASPTLLGERIYTPSGTGWIYGYNIAKKENDWEFYIGADLNGSMPVTDDNCFIVPIEKQYIKGKGGLMKIDPSKSPENSVIWFLPVDTCSWNHWEGGVIGSVSINDSYISKNELHIGVVIDIKGDMYLFDHTSVNCNDTVLCPNEEKYYPKPKILWKEKTVGTIATPIIVENKIIAPTDEGLFLYEIIFEKNDNISLKLLDKREDLQIDATPIVWNNRIYIADFNGYFYCLGENL